MTLRTGHGKGKGELDFAGPPERTDVLEAVRASLGSLHGLCGWCLPHRPKGVIRWGQ